MEQEKVTTIESKPGKSLTWPGQRLRQAREALNLSQQDVARQLHLNVLLIDREEFPRPRPCAGWISPAGIELCAACGLKARAAKALEFKGLRLHSWDLKRSVEVEDPELRGWLVDRAVFDHALLRSAVRTKAQTLLNAEVQELRQDDNGVRVPYRDTSTGEIRVAEADYCITTIPLGILGKLPTDLSEQVKEAMAAPGKMTVGKLALQFAPARKWLFDRLSKRKETVGYSGRQSRVMA